MKLFLGAVLALASLLQGMTIVNAPPPAVAGGTWTLVNHTKTACALSACNGTVPSTGSGHLLVFAMAYNTSTQITVSTPAAAFCTGSWVIPAGTTTYNSTNHQGTNAAYCLNSASGQTAFTSTLSTAITSDAAFDLIEYAWSGSTITLTGTPAGTNNSASTSPPGVAQTVSGSSNVIVQMIRGFNPTAISGSYNSPSIDVVSSVAFAGSMNTSVGTAPNWTMSSLVSQVASLAFTGS